MKLYSEIAPTIQFPTKIDAALQQTIYDWFQYREVADDEKFPVWFVRVLNRDFDRYNQLLRIEPGVSSYDWLVSKYRELEVKTSSEGESSSDVTLASEVNRTDETADHKVRTLEKDGTINDETTYGKVSTHSGGHTITDGTSIVNGTVASTDTRRTQTTGGWTDTESDGRTITDQRDTETIGSDDSTVNSRSWTTKNDKSLSKQAPMSTSYVGGVAEPTAPSGSSASGGTAGGALDWTSATSQGANFGRDDSGEEVTQHQGHIRNTDSRSVNGTLSKSRDYGQGLSEQHSGGVSTTTNKTETRNYSDIDNGVLTLSGSDAVEKTIDTTDTERVDGTVNKEGSTVTEGTTAVRNTNADEKTEHTIYTGRDEDPAELLKKASTFIKNSCAFEWLQNQLEVCFMGVYD